MAALYKVKLLATQCAVAGSPTRSPTTSPVIHLRRRKTLRMLLSRAAPSSRRLPRREPSPDRRRTTSSGAGSPEKSKELAVSHKLRDLFVSSPPLEDDRAKVRDLGEAFLPGAGVSGGGAMGGRRGAPRSLRPLSAAFRQRLLRRPWRPVLLTIPE
ncbi:uncharacterized protein LOC127809582 [Diospyros lotus]|uniref:uncharacterized protein LOC127809582 n=1 Tax=Diospyros lotus TaxID=55363 RepID=UPI0022565092|nr:uncharacterized protein LOC127809582 [Diospyros lotus]